MDAGTGDFRLLMLESSVARSEVATTQHNASVMAKKLDDIDSFFEPEERGKWIVYLTVKLHSVVQRWRKNFRAAK